MTPLQIIQLLDIAFAAADEAMIRVDRYREMRAESPDGHLTPEQRQQLATEAQAEIDTL